VPAFEVVQLSQLKLQEISIFGLNCQRLIINATVEIKIGIVLMSTDTSLRLAPNQSSIQHHCVAFVSDYDAKRANFRPDGKQIVSASWDGSLKLWDLTGNCLQTFTSKSLQTFTC
jgi:WD40 repeat protein